MHAYRRASPGARSVGPVLAFVTAVAIGGVGLMSPHTAKSGGATMWTESSSASRDVSVAVAVDEPYVPPAGVCRPDRWLPGEVQAEPSDESDDREEVPVPPAPDLGTVHDLFLRADDTVCVVLLDTQG